VQIIVARILPGDPSEALVAGSLDARPAFTSNGQASVSSVAFVRATENQNYSHRRSQTVGGGRTMPCSSGNGDAAEIIGSLTPQNPHYSVNIVGRAGGHLALIQPGRMALA
jgi:hypothetical protein